jgi:hypothetical protein
MHIFLEIIQLLVVETNRYYHQYLDTLDEEWFPLCDVTVHEMYSFLAIILQMGHDIKGKLKVSWSKAEQFSTPFHGKMKQDRLYHILRYLQFTHNRGKPEKRHDNFDRLWKIGTIFDMFNDA